MLVQIPRQERNMLGPLVVVLVLICLGGIVAWSPRCECGHRGAWHDPETPSLGCYKCECKEFKKWRKQ